MSFPSDILLPADAKYVAFADQKYNFNPDWDINWSFEYALSGQQQHAICTFLSTQSNLSGYPGHYMGYTGTIKVSSYLTTDTGNILLTDGGQRLYVDTESGLDYLGILAIAFDSTGLFALSSDNRPGVGIGSIKRNSLIIRNQENQVTFYEHLSNIDTSFILASSGKYYQQLRFRYANMGNKLSIDYKKSGDMTYTPLTSIIVNTQSSNYPIVNVGLSYCSPISSDVAQPSVLFLKNFHIQGDTNSTSVEVSPSIPLQPTYSSNYTTLCSVSAN